jgi:hypothetical protein
MHEANRNRFEKFLVRLSLKSPCLFKSGLFFPHLVLAIYVTIRRTVVDSKIQQSSLSWVDILYFGQNKLVNLHIIFFFFYNQRSQFDSKNSFIFKFRGSGSGKMTRIRILNTTRNPPTWLAVSSCPFRLNKHSLALQDPSV